MDEPMMFEGARADLRRLEGRPGEHVWVATAAYRLSAEQLRRMEPGELHLDGENLASLQVGCFMCEELYSDRLSYRRCPGDPAGGSRRARS